MYYWIFQVFDLKRNRSDEIKDDKNVNIDGQSKETTMNWCNKELIEYEQNWKNKSKKNCLIKWEIWELCKIVYKKVFIWVQ